MRGRGLIWIDLSCLDRKKIMLLNTTCHWPGSAWEPFYTRFISSSRTETPPDKMKGNTKTHCTTGAMHWLQANWISHSIVCVCVWLCCLVALVKRYSVNEINFKSIQRFCCRHQSVFSLVPAHLYFSALMTTNVCFLEQCWEEVCPLVANVSSCRNQTYNNV